MTPRYLSLTALSRANAWKPTAHHTAGCHLRYLVAAGLLIGASSVTLADEPITMTNGMTCWRNHSGHTYGCSGGVNTGDSGFNDTRTGTRYERIGPNQAIDTRSGQPMDLPPLNRSRNRNDQDEW